jgi:DNA modification methylase
MICGAMGGGWNGLMNKLYYGDNLEVLREHLATEAVDLVYLDPPFNSNRSYNVIFGNRSDDTDAAAQIQAFDDTWRWTPVTDQQYQQYMAGGVPPRVANALTAFRTLLGENDAMAYLVNMAPRLVELRRVLKPTGSLYLHCDPTMSHYLKVLLDAIFDPETFRSELIWKRTGSHNSAKRWAPVHDVLLFYTRADRYTWNQAFQPLPQETVDQWYNNVEPETGRRFNRDNLTAAGTRGGSSGEPWRGVDPTAKGRHWAIPGFMSDIVAGLSTSDALDALDAAGRLYWPKRAGGVPMLKRYLDESKGVPAQDVISDISPLNNATAERLGYPTQKPLALLERILSASSNSGDLVLDPFCGCGTTIDAAQRMGRRWVGIDITFIAIDLIEKRLRHAYGDSVSSTYAVHGIPRDIGGAQALFHHSAFDFERWAVSLVGAQPNEKQVGDKGMDGVARFYLDKQTIGRVLISVKGGKTLTPQFARELSGTVLNQKAQMGVLITMAEPSHGVIDEINHGGNYTWPINRQTFPRIQVITIRDLLEGKRPKMPTLMLPYIQAAKAPATQAQRSFDDLAAEAI